MSHSSRYAHELGTNYAAHGIAWERLALELDRDNVSRRIVRLARRAYFEQVARG